MKERESRGWCVTLGVWPMVGIGPGSWLQWEEKLAESVTRGGGTLVSMSGGLG